MRSVTIRDIAKKLKLSVSTVSRALSNHPDIKKETKAQVLKAAEELNYQPNLVAQNFRRSKTNILGVVVPDLITHFFSAVIAGIQNEATAKGYNIMICQSSESYETEVQNVKTLMSSRVDGILLSLSRETDDFEHLNVLHKRELPFVLFDRIYDELDVSKVTVDERDGAYKATEHLLQNGYHKIGHIAGPEKLSISRKRIAGYKDALKANNIELREDYIISSNFEKETVYAAMNRLLDLSEPPDAIFAVNDQVAAYAMFILKERGIKVPQDFGLIGFNNEPISEFVEPALSTIEQPAYQIGQLAARQLINQIDNPEEYVMQKIILKTKMIPRKSSIRNS